MVREAVPSLHNCVPEKSNLRGNGNVVNPSESASEVSEESTMPVSTTSERAPTLPMKETCAPCDPPKSMYSTSCTRNSTPVKFDPTRTMGWPFTTAPELFDGRCRIPVAGSNQPLMQFWSDKSQGGKS